MRASLLRPLPLEAPIPALATLIKLCDYQAQREQFFASMGSIQWFLRLHRERLVAAKALYLLRHQWFVAPEAFDRAIL